MPSWKQEGNQKFITIVHGVSTTGILLFQVVRVEFGLRASTAGKSVEFSSLPMVWEPLGNHRFHVGTMKEAVRKLETAWRSRFPQVSFKVT